MGIKEWNRNYLDCGIHKDSADKWYWWIRWNSGKEDKCTKRFDDEDSCVASLEDFLKRLMEWTIDIIERG